MNMFKTFRRIVLTGGYAGNSPIVPGTCGSVTGICAWVLLYKTIPCTKQCYLFLYAICLLLTGLLLTKQYLVEISDSHKLKLDAKVDPQEIVLDEWAGIFFGCAICMPSGIKELILVFLIFRFFDMLKPFFIKRLEKLPDEYGIFFDDVLAGIYAGLCMLVIH
jgi:phosphatidylglycerophosphatase A